MEIFFWMFIIYLLCCLAFGAYAYEMIERFDVPYKTTPLENRTKRMKDQIKLCSTRLLSK